MTTIQYKDTLPESAAHLDDAEGGYSEIWARTEDRVARLQEGSGISLRDEQAPGAPMDVLERRGWDVIPAESLPADGAIVTPSDTYHRRHSRIWRYWITTPQDLVEGVRQFVAAAESGGLPEGWTEKTAEDADGDQYVLCSFSLGMDGARSLGAEQAALGSLAKLPDEVHFFQTVAVIDGFGGVEKESRQPDKLDVQPYKPEHLFQTSNPDAADDRGSPFTESDVLSTTGLIPQ